VTELFDLTGRVAIVTGGNAGIGLGIARELSRAGAAVAIWGRREEANATAAAALERGGGRALAVTCDVADRGGIDAAMAATVEALGRVDACFASAGVSAEAHPFTEYPDCEWRRVLGVDLDGLFYTLRASARQITAGGEGGSIVAIGSVGSLFGHARHAPYAAAKAAVPGLTRTLAVELARYGVRVNTLLPGWIETDMTADLAASERLQKAVIGRIPMRRWGKPTDLGGIAVYLASDASKYHTGDVIRIDGGYAIF
jgi:NAD(P)-dependent dehydrogenase (short-subunit alcohol dehydrogenase family)